MSHDNPSSNPSIQFDPSKLRVLTTQDRDAVSKRYNERLTMAVIHDGDTQRTIQYTARRSHMRIVRVERIGESEAWSVIQDDTFPMHEDRDPEIHSDALTMLTGADDSPPFHMVPLQAMSYAEYSSRFGHKFHPAA